jgi:hypothetical protein
MKKACDLLSMLADGWTTQKNILKTVLFPKQFVAMERSLHMSQFAKNGLYLKRTNA